ncbi:hypothetical protein FI667_g17597, partial [Globisporangium splendens]
MRLCSDAFETVTKFATLGHIFDKVMLRLFINSLSSCQAQQRDALSCSDNFVASARDFGKMQMPRRLLSGVRVAGEADRRYEQPQRHATLPTASPAPERAAVRQDVDDFERWKHAARAQEDDQLLLHQTLAKQRAFIRHEKRKLLLQNALLESERERFEASLTSDWFCSSVFPSEHDRRITIDVGGQLFEISSALASKDSGSLLAAFVDDGSPLSASECVCFRIDRDWWLFRYVLSLLRDGILPHDPKLLRELYPESEFWKLDSLRKAIEMRNIELLQIQQESEAAATLLAASASTGIGMKTKAVPGNGTCRTEISQRVVAGSPVWWGSDATASKTENAKSDEPPAKVSAFASILKKAAKANTVNASGKEDNDTWWKSTTYKGVDFVEALSPEKNKKQQHHGSERHEDDDTARHRTTPRAPLIVNTTWPSSHHLQG